MSSTDQTLVRLRVEAVDRRDRAAGAVSQAFVMAHHVAIGTGDGAGWYAAAAVTAVDKALERLRALDESLLTIRRYLLTGDTTDHDDSGEDYRDAAEPVDHVDVIPDLLGYPVSVEKGEHVPGPPFPGSPAAEAEPGVDDWIGRGFADARREADALPPELYDAARRSLGLSGDAS